MIFCCSKDLADELGICIVDMGLVGARDLGGLVRLRRSPISKETPKASGDFAMAYVIAHEVGHHVQNELGILGKYHRMQQGLSEKERNAISVRIELQADYLAGVWARSIQDRNLLDIGDIEEAMNAAHAVGDDTLQEQAYGYSVPDSFTHGTSEQRMRWFKRGYQYGDLQHGDTFSLSDSEL